MNRTILAAALVAALTSVSSVPAAAARNYDCSKAGNANKAQCKGAAKAASVAKPAPKVVAAKPAKEPKPAATRTVTHSYDCSKAGNANKAQCKSSSTVATSVTKPAAAAPAKPGIFQRMSNALRGSSTPAPKAAAAPRRSAASAPASVEDRNPAGAIAQCKDGTYSHAKGRTGACSRHGGVAKWS